MNAHGCCTSTPASPGWARRCAQGAGWVAPGAVLALMPKCPACVAAYIALATGIGLSLDNAALLRSFLLLVCVASLCGLAAWRLRRYLSDQARHAGRLFCAKRKERIVQ
ncbi:MAG: hypothetical protein HYV27_06910 [Candidatus Hydrogenedentes bacterium]|nr:hypothetical protein [Candidatus Hydrogenedentota bacterium]